LRKLNRKDSRVNAKSINRTHSWAAVVALLLVLWAGCAAAQVNIERLDPPEEGFFGKRATVHGIQILAHASVSDEAIQECARRLNRELAGTPVIAENLRLMGAQMQVIGKDQAVSDLPMYREMKGKPFEGKQTIDERGRGYGGLYCSCCEENLLKLPSDRWRDHRDICMHEFAHTILSFGVSKNLPEAVQRQWKKSTEAGKWKTMYAATNPQEFFAELTMWYFGSRGDYGKNKPSPEPGADWLKTYDPQAFELLDDIYTGRLISDRMRVVDLSPLGREAEGKIRSKSNQPETEVVFINRTAKPVQRFWLDTEGKRRGYGTIPPGSVQSQSTFATHAWLLTGKDREFLGIYVPDERIGRIIIGGSSGP